jgi:tripartite-type tricarboxylate transporter receptor subunit TctC
MRKLRTELATLAASCVLLSQAALAQKYPERPLKIVIGYSAGTTDLIARLAAQQLTERLGQNVVVENRPGATGIIAVESVARSAPDGYTFLIVSSGEFTVLPALKRALSYDPLRDFIPLALLADVPVAYVIHPSVPANTIQEFIQYARKNPGKLRHGSAGIGNILHLAGEMLKLRARIDMVHVPYKGAGEMIPAVVGGQIEMIPLSPGSVAKFVSAGQLRALAVSSARRSEIMPGVPTMIEAGFPDFGVSTWWGAVIAAQVSEPIVARLSGELLSIASSPSFRARIRDLGGTVEPLSRERFGAMIAKDIRGWRELGAAAKISLDD